MSAGKKLADEVMALFQRPLSLDRVYIDDEAIPGAVLSGIYYQQFMSLKAGHKLLLIREWLDEMYPGEFTRVKVAEKIMYSYQGLKNVENCTKSTRESTLRALVEAYNVQIEILELRPRENDSDNGGFYIGKIEDRFRFYLAYYEQHGENHFLDDSDYTNIYKDIERTRASTLQVEFIMRVHEPGDRDTLNDRVIMKTELSPEDVKDMHDLIVKNAEILSRRHFSAQVMEDELRVLTQRLMLYSKLGDKPEASERKMELENAYKDLFDVLKTKGIRL